ncbi:hypothetical protein RF11_09074 [Thelohanellus kitauei]|uniref:Uncharacterized protein n=1 Tax=Thelohanellus kitauei TaxID=669202 RepID=A0A0C2MXF4_THEKT|nr:hypothetical protein RF11_09074 [Thelohanellus kitauei]
MKLELDSQMDGFEIKPRPERSKFIRKEYPQLQQKPHRSDEQSEHSRTRLSKISKRKPLNPLREEQASSNEEAKSVSTLRDEGAYVCHARTYPQMEIDRQQTQDSWLLPGHLT